MAHLLPLLAACSLLTLSSVASATNYSSLIGFDKIEEWNQGLNWTSCPETPDDPRFSCTNFTMPLDWHNESAGLGQLGLARYAADPDKKVGSIFVNDGGPGLSGRSFAFSYADHLSNSSNAMYDIIGVDPRGVGAITVPGDSRCVNTTADYLELFNNTIVYPTYDYRDNFTDEAEIQGFYDLVEPTEEAFSKLYEVCEESGAAPLLQYVGTVAFVRDIVAMQDFFDGEGSDVNFWGMSYGSIVGTTLVNMFPDRVGRVIVDAIVDPVIYWVGRTDLSWADAVERSDEALQGFANGCLNAGPEKCLLADQSIRGDMDFVTWTHNLTNWAHDIAGAGNLIRGSLFQALYAPRNWGKYANGELLDMYNYVANGSLASIDPSSIAFGDPEAPASSEIQLAIECGDAADPEEGLTLKDVIDELLRVTQDVSGYFGNSQLLMRHRCSSWKYRAAERFNGPFNSTLQNKILVLTTQNDVITPPVNAMRLAHLLGDSAAYIEQKGYGHSTTAEDSACLEKIYNEFFANGTTPSGNNTVCDVDDSDSLFDPPSTNFTASG